MSAGERTGAGSREIAPFLLALVAVLVTAGVAGSAWVLTGQWRWLAALLPVSAGVLAAGLIGSLYRITRRGEQGSGS